MEEVVGSSPIRSIESHPRVAVKRVPKPLLLLWPLLSPFFSTVLWAAVPLVIPLVAMQFTDEVNWSVDDFIVAWLLLAGTALAYKLFTRRAGTFAYRFAVGIAVIASLLLMWVNLAVGIIGSEDNPANLMYFGVVALGLVGVTIVRLQPLGMARVLFAMAIAQALVPLVALLIWKPPLTIEVLAILGVNAVFVVLFVASALLFLGASRALARA